MTKPTANYLKFLKTNTSRFRGEWIVLTGNKIVAHGKRADIAYQQALKDYPHAKLSLARIPRDSTLIYGHI